MPPPPPPPSESPARPAPQAAASPSPHRFSARAAPVDRPLPLWILYPLFFILVYAAHWPLLRLPYFWDEAGYYIPAALDLLRTGSLIPHSTLTNAHPPLPSLLLAAWWSVCGFNPMSTRTLICLVSAAALLAVFRLARTLAGNTVAASVTLLTAIYPVWFAQSTLAHADIFAAAFTLWALSVYLQRFTEPARPQPFLPVALLFSLAALAKETAIVTPIVLAAWELAQALTSPSSLRLQRGTPDSRAKRQDPHPEAPQTSPPPSLPWLLTLLAPILPLALWYLYHLHHTGFLFGNPEFLRYNASANLTPTRILLSLWHRTVHLTLHMGMYVPVLCTVAVLLIPRPAAAPARLFRRPILLTLAVVVLGNALALSVLGGALLTRYLLPLYPLILLVCAGLWQQRLRLWGWIAGLSALAFTSALTINPPYPFAPEDNLTYRDMIVLHQQAIHLIATRFPQATVLSAWPATAELQHPDLGYTPHPFPVAPLENFSAAEIQKAAADPGAFDTALVFSTKWVPPPGRLNLSRANEPTDARLFDFHRDLSPAEIAVLLRGQIIWQSTRHGEWAAVLHFPRIVEARTIPPPLIGRLQP